MRVEQVNKTSYMAANADIERAEVALELIGKIEAAVGLADALGLSVVAIHLQMALDLLQKQAADD